MRLPHAVIIAGGQGQRLGGVRKANLRIGGVTLLDRVTQSLGPVAEPTLVSTGPEGRWIELAERFAAVADLSAPCAGPLAGLSAAISNLRQRGIASGLLVSVAADTPFLPTDFLARMIAALGDGRAAYAAWDGDFYPPNAVWQIEAIADLPELIGGPTPPNSLKALQKRLGARQVDWFEPNSTNPFLNVNTVADLVALGRMARKREALSRVIHTSAK